MELTTLANIGLWLAVALFVAAMLYGLARQQLYEYRIRRRLDRRVRSLRRR